MQQERSPLFLEQYECVVFDMDGTLAESKSQVTENMAKLLQKLLEQKYVAVISGGAFSQFEKQLIRFIGSQYYPRLIILPTSGASLYQYRNKKWVSLYTEEISVSERARIITTLLQGLEKTGYAFEKELYGERIEDRVSQITFSGMGSTAPYEKKRHWDADQKKRKEILVSVGSAFRDYTVTMGGTSSIDITIKGIDKAYGIKKISALLGMPISKMLFVGDKLQEGGNDYPVVKTKIQTVAVIDEHDTEALLCSWLTE